LNGVKSIIVIGLGRFGSALCERLKAHKMTVIVVDRDKEKVEAMADVADLAAQLDSTDKEALTKIGTKEMDVAVVAIGEDVESSILTTAILKEFDIPQIISRAQNPLHARILARVGAHKVIFPERDMGWHVADLIANPWLQGFSQLPRSDILIGEIKPTEEMIGKSLADLQFSDRYGAVVVLAERGGEKFLPKANYIIEREDRLTIAGSRDDIKKLMERYEKEKEDS
jgi:trk system potassium uptake protein TrkA